MAAEYFIANVSNQPSSIIHPQYSKLGYPQAAGFSPAFGHRARVVLTGFFLF